MVPINIVFQPTYNDVIITRVKINVIIATSFTPHHSPNLQVEFRAVQQRIHDLNQEMEARISVAIEAVAADLR